MTAILSRKPDASLDELRSHQRQFPILLIVCSLLVLTLFAPALMAQAPTTTTLTANTTSVTYPASVTFTGDVAPSTASLGGVPSGNLTIAGPGGPLSAPLALVPSTQTFTYSAVNTANTIPTLGTTQAVATADFNGDGIPDLAVSYNGGVIVLLGPGPGFTTTYPLGSSGFTETLSQLIVGDYNGDGAMDVAGVDDGPSTVTEGQIAFELNSGDGTVETAITPNPCFGANGFLPCELAAGQYHEAAPTHDDIVFSNGTNVFLLTFAAPNAPTQLVLPATGSCIFVPSLVAPGKFTASGHLDLILIGYYTANPEACTTPPTGYFLELYEGDGLGDLGNATGAMGPPNLEVALAIADATKTTQSLTGIAIGDFNGDGNADVVLAEWDNNGAVAGGVSGWIRLLTGNGAGALTAQPNFQLTAYTTEPFNNTLHVVAQDFLNNGDTDLIVMSQTDGLPVLLLNPGTAAWQATTLTAAGYPLTSSQTTVAAADFNEDTYADFAICGNIISTVSIPELAGYYLTGTAQAVFAPAILPGGSDSMTATFAADHNYTTSTSAPLVITVARAATSVAVTSVNPATEVYGSLTPTVVTATLSWTGAGAAPTGGLTFTTNAPRVPGGHAPGSFGAPTCVGATSPITCTATFTPDATDSVGTYSMTANYAGDVNYLAAGNTQTNDFSITQQAPTVTVTSVNPATESYGSLTPAVVTATLSWTGGGVVPTGGLAFTTNAPRVPGRHLPGTFGAPTCTGATSPITCTATFTPDASDTVGTYTMSASFAGDTNYSSAASTQTNNFSITQLAPTVDVTSVNPATEVYGSLTPTVVTATLSWTGGGVAPTGGLAFTTNAPRVPGRHLPGTFGAPTCSGATSPITCTTTFTPDATDFVGTYTMTATFAGDANYGAVGSPEINNFSITQLAPTVDVTSVNPATEVYGSLTPTIVTATLSWAGGGVAPTGGLAFTTNAPRVPGRQRPGTFGAPTCTGATSPITCTATFTPDATDAAGTYTMTANFAGDTNYGAASSLETNNFSVTQATPAVDVTSVSPATESYGSLTPTVVTATLSWTGAGAAPTGGLAFTTNAPRIPGRHLPGSFGTATCTGATSPITCTATFTPDATDMVATYTMTASYAGDTSYAAAGSPETNNFSITPQTPTVDVVSVNPATQVYGSLTPAVVTATLSWTGGVTAPTGGLSFSTNAPRVPGRRLPGSFGATSCTGAASPITCTATFTPDATDTAGTYTMSAAFAGDLNYASASSPETGNFSITLQTTAVTVTNVTPTTVSFGASTPTTVTATLAWTGGGLAPSGMLAFNSTAGGSFGTAVCIGTISPITCTATFTPSPTDPIGPYNLSASYAGDVNYAAGSSSTSINNITVAGPTTTSITFTGPATGTSGSPVTVSFGIDYPAEAVATFTLTFAAATTPAVDDPSIQFAAGGRTFTTTVPAGTTALTTIPVQTGTTEGTITVTAAISVAGVDVTPPTLAPVVTVIAPTAPVLDTASATLTRNGNSFQITINGYSNTREAGLATFTFTAASGKSLGTSYLIVPVDTVFRSYFDGATSDAFGGQFSFTQPFTLKNGTAADVASVTVTLSNSKGDSAVVTVQ